MMLPHFVILLIRCAMLKMPMPVEARNIIARCRSLLFAIAVAHHYPFAC
jgi:hypothetical protein